MFLSTPDGRTTTLARSLLFSIAVNGYSMKYRSLLATQRAYARRIGCEYVCVQRPVRVLEPAVAAWMKVTLMEWWLGQGRDFVGYLDADCEVKADAPDWRGLFESDGSVLMARGRSGRYNSGVVFVRNDAPARQYFADVLASATHELPDAARRNLKYENGNMHHVAGESVAIREIGAEWNNTATPDLTDFVRHYTGPLASSFQPGRTSALSSRLVRATVRTPTRAPKFRDDAFMRDLAAHTKRAVKRYGSV